ncbi:putative dipeptidyl peptidase III [Rosellinia necatrix]|uniref:Putative dipeptidyl peptidase III n=1 Tax=Rosellinia necatrix TaxID=77044 RepID=A0A1S7ULI6_ROSNE|nr:putative dipeptidyl peptidase III [Rosellinia necatrix]
MPSTSSFALKKVRQPKNTSFDLFPGLSWYTAWLQKQLKLQPSFMFDSLPELDCEDEGSLASKILPLCTKIADIIEGSEAPSISSIVKSLFEDGSISAGDEHQILDSATSLVFAIIGWLTMLYRPDTLSCPSNEFCIVDEMDGHRGEGHMSLKQGRMGSSKRLSDFLLGFGVMLPPANYHAIEDPEEIKAYDKLGSVDSSALNLFLLTTIGGVSVEWTDCLACHLELNKDARLNKG